MSITHRFLKEPSASHETASFSPLPLSDMETGTKFFAPIPMRAVSVGFAYHGVMYAASATFRAPMPISATEASPRSVATLHPLCVLNGFVVSINLLLVIYRFLLSGR